MDIKAYDLFLKPHELPLFYGLDGILTLVTDEKNPRPLQTSQRWNKSKQTLEPSRKSLWITTISIPTWEVLKEDFEDCVNAQLFPTLEAFLNVGVEGNIFLVRKDCGDFWEFGICACAGRGVHVNEYATHLIDQYMKLKAFW
jgi:hypothetical protein